MLCNVGEVWVLKLSGWDTSAGVRADRAIAGQLGMAVKEIGALLRRANM